MADDDAPATSAASTPASASSHHSDANVAHPPTSVHSDGCPITIQHSKGPPVLVDSGGDGKPPRRKSMSAELNYDLTDFNICRLGKGYNRLNAGQTETSVFVQNKLKVVVGRPTAAVEMDFQVVSVSDFHKVSGKFTMMATEQTNTLALSSSVDWSKEVKLTDWLIVGIRDIPVARLSLEDLSQDSDHCSVQIGVLDGLSAN